MDGRSLTKRQSDQAEAIAALRNAAPALLDMAAECLRLRGYARHTADSLRWRLPIPEYNELLRELDGAGFELESRAASAIRRLREKLASLATDALETGSRASKIISRLCAERDRLAAEVEKLREERDAARHNSFTESAERDRLAELVRELEQENEALRRKR